MCLERLGKLLLRPTNLSSELLIDRRLKKTLIPEPQCPAFPVAGVAELGRRQLSQHLIDEMDSSHFNGPDLQD